jgi:hypothetical protein
MNSNMSGPIFYVCNDPERALGLETTIEDFHIVCIDNSPFIKAARKVGVKIFSLAEIEENPNPVYRSSAKLLENPKVQAYINKNTPKGEIPNIVVFKVSLKIEKVCREEGYKLLNTTSALNKKFELKISQYNNLNNLIAFFPRTIISTLGKITYSELKRKLGENFVIQYNRGHTGKNTIFIENEKQYMRERKKFPNRLARIAKYIEGEMYTMNMCVTRFGMVYGGLSYQITGVEELTSKKGGTVGNDWLYPEKLRENTHNQIRDILNKLQITLYNSGYRGMVGIDLAVTKRQRVYLIEVNARQPASTSIHTKLMLNEEFIPLQAFHFAEFLFEEDNVKYMKFLNKYFNKGLVEQNVVRYIVEQNKLAMIPIEAAQVSVRNTTSKRKQIKENIEQGLYVYNKKFVKTGEGYNIQDIIPGEYLVLATRKNQLVSPDNEIARIQCLEGLIDEDCKIQKKFNRIIRQTNNKIKIK